MQDFTCNGVFLQCRIGSFTEVKDLNTSSVLFANVKLTFGIL